MDYYKESLRIHEEHKGKIAIASKVPLNNKDDLSVAYTPGVAQPCKEISQDPEKVYQYTSKGNTVAIITDGTAVLGLGNIGAKAAIPVMEGKAILFKKFADIDAIPICLSTQDTAEVIQIIKNISATFGGINLEDIAAPRCFEIEKKLQELLDIPVFHDDQHGTAIVATAAVINALKVVRKDLKKAKVVVNGAGAAGTAITKMLLAVGIRNVTVCDRSGILSKSMKGKLNPAMYELSCLTNPEMREGNLADALKGADVFIGVSAPRLVSAEMIGTMNKDAIIFAMANPEPEVMPDVALKAGARIVGTGRSDFPNQINNVLVFPGVFKGALASRASRITEDMKVAAAFAIAQCIPEAELNETNIIPSVFDANVVDAVAVAVAKAWEAQTCKSCCNR